MPYIILIIMLLLSLMTILCMFMIISDLIHGFSLLNIVSGLLSIFIAICTTTCLYQSLPELTLYNAVGSCYLIYHFVYNAIDNIIHVSNINKLKTMTYDAKLSTSTYCIICHEDFNNNDVISLLPCTHSYNYHSSCITTWLTKRNMCPLCCKQVIY